MGNPESDLFTGEVDKLFGPQDAAILRDEAAEYLPDMVSQRGVDGALITVAELVLGDAAGDYAPCDRTGIVSSRMKQVAQSISQTAANSLIAEGDE